MPTQETRRRAQAQAHSCGISTYHQFGGPEPDNYAMLERILQVPRPSTPVRQMLAHDARRGIVRRIDPVTGTWKYYGKK